MENKSSNGIIDNYDAMLQSRYQDKGLQPSELIHPDCNPVTSTTLSCSIHPGKAPGYMSAGHDPDKMKQKTMPKHHFSVPCPH